MPALLNSPNRYGLIGRFLHWSMALLLLVGYVTGEVAEDALEHGAKGVSEGLEGLAAGLHSAAGVAVLGLLGLRIVWRLIDHPLPPPPGAPRWEEKAAKWAHIALYAVLAAMPLSGLALAMTGKEPLAVRGLGWLGIDQIPVLLSSRFLNEGLEEVHEAMVSLLITIVTLHVAASVWHAVVRRDGVAQRMIPFLKMN